MHGDELSIPVFQGLSPSEEVGGDEEQETDDETQEIFADSEETFYESSTP